MPAARFFHPLDGVAGWNRIYGRRGLVQYQMVVPDGAEETVRRTVEALEHGALRLVPRRAQTLRAGQSRPAVLPAVGLDARARHAGRASTGWPRCWMTWTSMIVAAGGRVYLAKDARLRPELLEAMYPAPARLAGRAGPGGPRPPALLRPGPPAARAGRTDPGRSRRMKDALGAVQSVLVLGGASDIGVAIAARLAAPRQATVILAGRHPDALQAAPRPCGPPAPGRVETLAFDAEDPDSHDATIAAAVRLAGGDLDVIILAFGLLGDQDDRRIWRARGPSGWPGSTTSAGCRPDWPWPGCSEPRATGPS